MAGRMARMADKVADRMKMAGWQGRVADRVADKVADRMRMAGWQVRVADKVADRMADDRLGWLTG